MVTMYCTAKSIEEGAGDIKKKYARAVSRIWSGQIREIEMSDVAKIVELGQDDMLRWVNDIEAGVLDADVCENALARNELVNLIGHVRSASATCKLRTLNRDYF
ncbi:hypothetical protein L2E82_20424 [Cichorium intybus]|uniref:Uncharacterized protein n=1 Tax=Cichorium intybus TaxID=13427 RepID=A0ACB9DU28_CICIN|nr:hypothetical protein L2E82_20424 [Cichorium intybus]